jgi:hypothetical protein
MGLFLGLLGILVIGLFASRVIEEDERVIEDLRRKLNKAEDDLALLRKSK